jgi:hypothetical protein
MPRSRKPVYCGTQDVVPAKYSRVGTPHECLKKGVGIGIMTSTQEKKIQMIRKMIQRPLTKEQLVNVALTLSINIYNDNNNRMLTKEQIKQKIRQRMGG